MKEMEIRIKPKVFHCRTSKTGPTVPVTVVFSKYIYNNRLAVQLTTAKAPWEPYATLTVNLDGERLDSSNQAFVDTNNCPWAPEFLEDNGIAKPTGVTAKSGFCTYPLYEFSRDAIYTEE